MSINIMVVDDEPKINEIICAYLIKEKYNVFSAFSGNEALEIFLENEIDLIILDLMLPDLSGEEVCRQIKEKSDIPVIMLTAKTQEEDILNGFKIGSDDYILKPFSPKLLVARVNAVLNRTKSLRKSDEDIYSYNNEDLIVDINNYEVKKKDESIFLTPSEFKILKILIENPKKIFTRNELLDIAFSEDTEVYDRTIDSHIKNLRAKIEDNKKIPVYIKTIYGVGYRFGGESDL